MLIACTELSVMVYISVMSYLGVLFSEDDREDVRAHNRDVCNSVKSTVGWRILFGEVGNFLPFSGIKIREIWLQGLIPHPQNTLKWYFFLLANLPKNTKCNKIITENKIGVFTTQTGTGGTKTYTKEWSPRYACFVILIWKAKFTALDSNEGRLVLWMRPSAPLRSAQGGKIKILTGLWFEVWGR